MTKIPSDSVRSKRVFALDYFQSSILRSTTMQYELLALLVSGTVAWFAILLVIHGVEVWQSFDAVLVCTNGNANATVARERKNFFIERIGNKELKRL